MSRLTQDGPAVNLISLARLYMSPFASGFLFGLARNVQQSLPASVRSSSTRNFRGLLSFVRLSATALSISPSTVRSVTNLSDHHAIAIGGFPCHECRANSLQGSTSHGCCLFYPVNTMGQSLLHKYVLTTVFW